jgi:predicted tellurium resistance membrane protein TerC
MPTELLDILLAVPSSLPLLAADASVALDAAGAVAAEAAEASSDEVESFFSVQGLMTLGMLVLLQAVLGFDNLLYISIESKRVAEDKQSMVRKTGIALAIVFRIALLFILIKVIEVLQGAFLTLDSDFIRAAISGHSLIVLGGGAFILWTAMKEIYHLLAIHDLGHADDQKRTGGSVGRAITLIVLMNLVFSFDSILSAMALTKNEWIMATAIVLSGLMMILLADHVAEFLKKNRMYEVLGLFILFIVGVMLVSEGGHLAHLELFGHEVHPMAKSTFYFVLLVLIVVDVAQSRYQKKLLAQRELYEARTTAG